MRRITALTARRTNRKASVRIPQEADDNMKFTDAQKEQAANISIIDYLNRANGFTFKKAGRYYQCVEHDSLMIYPDQKGWAWNSQGIKGSDVLAWKQKIEGLTYPEAMNELLGIESNSNSYSMADEVKATERKPFELPERNGNNQRVIAYLVKTRQLDRHIVNDCIKQGVIYEDKRHNVVAVGCDENGEAKSADLRSSSTYGAKFRGCVTESEKRYGFHLDSNCNSDTVFVFEAFIDSLSFLSLRNMSAKARNNPDYYKKFNVLALGGTSDNALTQYVISRPQISNVVLMLDNDNAGREGAMKIKSKYEKFNLNCTIRTMPEAYSGCKDQNDLLKAFKESLNQSYNSKTAVSQTRKISTDQEIVSEKKLTCSR